MAVQRSNVDSSALNIIAECEGCGVCCLHMGYPAFQLPREPLTEAEIRADVILAAEIKKDPRRLEELLAGHPWFEPGSLWTRDLPWLLPALCGLIACDSVEVSARAVVRAGTARAGLSGRVAKLRARQSAAPCI